MAAFVAAYPMGRLVDRFGPKTLPALYTFLAISWGQAGWLVIAAIAVVASAGLHRSARTAQRFLERHGVPPTSTDDASLKPASSA